MLLFCWVCVLVVLMPYFPASGGPFLLHTVTEKDTLGAAASTALVGHSIDYAQKPCGASSVGNA